MLFFCHTKKARIHRGAQQRGGLATGGIALLHVRCQRLPAAPPV
jgi:hypothetical protein